MQRNACKKCASFDWSFNQEINVRTLKSTVWVDMCAFLSEDLYVEPFFCLWFLQESVEALPSSESMSFPAGLPCLHGLHDLPVLPYGLLAAHNHLLQHPHVTAGTQTLHNNTNEQSLSQHIYTPAVSSFVSSLYDYITNIILW